MLKKFLSKREINIYCNVREIWWCSIGMNIGSEIYGKNEFFERPILIIKVYNKETISVIPLTSKIKYGKYYFSPIILKNTYSCAVLSQTRTISSKRLSRKIGRISRNNFQDVWKHYLLSL